MNEAIQDSKVHDSLYAFKKQGFFMNYLIKSEPTYNSNNHLFFGTNSH